VLWSKRHHVVVGAVDESPTELGIASSSTSTATAILVRTVRMKDIERVLVRVPFRFLF
jgi:hypothetical protein